LSTLLPGTELGRYRLIRRLAVGGMAELYLASARGIEGFEKPVVLKRIRQELATDGDSIRMFLDEARLGAMMHHPNIVQVFDIGQASTTRDYFYAMEYVEGADLRALLEKAAGSAPHLPHAHAVSIAMGIAAGLHHAHELTSPERDPLGVVHRDISPANVIVSRDGCVKIIDFGIARGEHRSSVTRVGLLKGKVSYMSPEQLQDEPLDRRTDIFSLGVVLYELTVGSRPFKGANEAELALKIAHQDAPSPRSIDPSYPEALERIVLTALAKDRKERYATARHLQLALEELARDTPLEISPLALADYIQTMMVESGERDTEPLLARDDRAATTRSERAPTRTVTVPAAEPTLRAPAPKRRSSQAVLLAAAGLLAVIIGVLIAKLWIQHDDGARQSALVESAPRQLSETTTRAAPISETSVSNETTPSSPPRRTTRPRRALAHPAPQPAAKSEPGTRWDPDSPFASDRGSGTR
jgi:serine/threonine protein kinase